jgi:ABC-2 type transport system permease protein
MKKALIIGWKDLSVLVRDPAALTFMLAAPFLLTLAMGLVTGSAFGGSGAGMAGIRVIIVNQDGGPVGAALVDALRADDLADLLSPSVLRDPAAARALVDADTAAMAVIVPPGFTDGLLAGVAPRDADARGPAGAAAARPAINLYANPNSPTGAGVVEGIVREFCDRAAARALGTDGGAPAYSLTSTVSEGRSNRYNPLTLIAPGLALMFLMYRVTNGGRSLLVERDQGTLSRLAVSPTSSAQVLGGKVIGIFVSGVAQVLILVLASTLIFRLRWGDPLGVLLLVLSAVAGATGWGFIVAALARTTGQVSAIGTTLMLAFGVLSGSFFGVEAMPAWLRAAAKISPNAWGMDGFRTLAGGGTLADVAVPMGALLLMGTLLFTISTLVIGRRGLARA